MNIVKLKETNQFTSFCGAPPSQIVYASLPYMATKYHFSIKVGEAVVDGIHLRETVLFIESDQGEGFFYKYNDYVNCFELDRQFKTKHGENYPDEWSDLYYSTFDSLAVKSSIPSESFYEVMSSNDGAME